MAGGRVLLEAEPPRCPSQGCGVRVSASRPVPANCSARIATPQSNARQASKPCWCKTGCVPCRLATWCICGLTDAPIRPQAQLPFPRGVHRGHPRRSRGKRLVVPDIWKSHLTFGDRLVTAQRLYRFGTCDLSEIVGRRYLGTLGWSPNMRALLAIVIFVGGAFALNSPADAARKIKGAKAYYYAVQPLGFWRAGSACARRACAYDPTGEFASYPGWARKAFSEGRR